MKLSLSGTFVSILALAVAAGACQQAAPDNGAAARPAASPPPALPADSTAAVLALLRVVDLSRAWTGSDEAAMEGFYGPNHYRISFHLDRVWRDEQQPNLYHVEGRDRYKRVITPFTATLTVTRLAVLPDTGGLWHAGTHRAYSAFASFVLRENPQAKGAGHCSGRAVLDFVVSPQSQALRAGFTGVGLGEGNPTKGCGQIFRGTWQDNRTGRRQPVVWANSYSVILPTALARLGLHERMEFVNPKLARYGWNTILENDEWWATSPKPKLTL